MPEILYRILRSRKASAAVYLGIAIMLVALVAIIVCINYYSLYSTHLKAQLICDTIADGAAIAGQTVSGYDEDKVREVAEKLFENNKMDGVQQTYTLEIKDVPNANEKLIVVEMKTEASFYGAKFLDIGELFNANTRSVVQVKYSVIADTWIQESFYNRPNDKLTFAASIEGNRNASYINWLVEYYLNPEKNPLYLFQNSAPRSHYLIYDYIKCMGLKPGDPKTLSEWKNYFASQDAKDAGWIVGADPTALQAEAELGKPVLIIQTMKDGTENFFIVVPQRQVLPEGYIAVAYANHGTTNYKAMCWSDLLLDESSVIAVTHE